MGVGWLQVWMGRLGGISFGMSFEILVRDVLVALEANLKRREQEAAL
jgi:hypothetical protein